MQNETGIVYLIENAQQFWSELEDIINVSDDDGTTLLRLDSSLNHFLSFCASYHEQYLQSPFQLEHACDFLLNSELFAFHSERMSEALVAIAKDTTDPHIQFILYSILLFHGRRQQAFFRSIKRWKPLLPLLLDHVLVQIDPEIEATYLGGQTGASVPIPIEAKLRNLGVRLLYEICRVQKLRVEDLRIFNDSFIDYLFDLVEQTRDMQDDTFNYSVVKLIVALNEQFMLASVNPHSAGSDSPSARSPHPVHLSRVQPSSIDVAQASAQDSPSNTRIFSVLLRRLWNSKTFGENMIFMLNRATRSAEDLCMQMLVLKILYLLFTNKGTSEYFYTNDLCVLVDVILREIVDLDEDCESLRHTYLRVLLPLLTKTQLAQIPYKRAQIVLILESMIKDRHGVRNVNPTTKRLVEKVLNGEWCTLLRRRPSSGAFDRTEGELPSNGHVNVAEIGRSGSPESGTTTSGETLSSLSPGALVIERQASQKGKTLKTSRSAVGLSSMAAAGASLSSATGSQHAHLRSTLDDVMQPASGGSLAVPGTKPKRPPRVPRSATSVHGQKEGARALDALSSVSASATTKHTNSNPSRPSFARASATQLRATSHSVLPNAYIKQAPSHGSRCSPPATPVKRRKPPAVPVAARSVNTTIATIRSTS